MDLFASVFNHLVLPAKLPSQRDLDPQATAAALLARLESACQVVDKEFGDEWSPIKRCLGRCKGIRESRFDAQELRQDWIDLRPDDVCLLRLAEQNAALLIRRCGAL